MAEPGAVAEPRAAVPWAMTVHRAVGVAETETAAESGTAGAADASVARRLEALDQAHVVSGREQFAETKAEAETASAGVIVAAAGLGVEPQHERPNLEQ